MAGPISIENSQQAIDMLKQLQSGQSYMISSDGKSIQEATLGHKIRQFFGFSSAKAENKAALDLIKNTIRDDPRYADVADTMFQGVQEGKALTAETIKAAFKSVQDNLITQTNNATDKIVDTLFVSVATSTAKEKVDAIVARMKQIDTNAKVPPGSDESKIGRIKDYLKAAVRVAMNNQTQAGNPFSRNDIKKTMDTWLETLHQLTDPRTNDAGFEDCVNSKINAAQTNAKPAATDADHLSTLNETNISLTTVKANHIQSESYKSINEKFNALQSKAEFIVSKTKKETMDEICFKFDQLEQWMNFVADHKLESDTRDYMVRLSTDSQFKKDIASLCNSFRKAINEFANSLPSKIKANSKNTKTAVADLTKMTAGAMPKDMKGNLEATLAKLGQIKANGEFVDSETGANLQDHITMLTQLKDILTTVGMIK